MYQLPLGARQTAISDLPSPSKSRAVFLVVCLVAEQVAVVPPLLPAQVQLQGLPVPVTVEAVPVVQRLVVGAMVTVLLLLAPQAPLVGV